MRTNEGKRNPLTHVFEGSKDSCEEFNSYHADLAHKYDEELSSAEDDGDAEIATQHITSEIIGAFNSEYKRNFSQGNEEMGINLNFNPTK